MEEIVIRVVYPFDEYLGINWFDVCKEGGVVIIDHDTWNDPMMVKDIPNLYLIVVTDIGLPANDTRPNLIIKTSQIPLIIRSFKCDLWVVKGLVDQFVKAAREVEDV